MTKLIAVMILSVSGVTIAAASSSFHSTTTLERGNTRQFAAPEIDPSSALTALTMLFGGVTVLRSRFAKK